MPHLRIVFAGTPAVAVPTLERLAASGHEVVGVVTRPPAPLGRKRVLTPSPVAQAAERLGLPVIDAVRLDVEATERIAALRPDLGVVVAYGGLVREPLLSTPPHGWINLHFSALPAWRGAAPVQRALIAGDAELGASVFRLVPELDAGDVYASRTRPVAPGETAGLALESLAETEAELVLGVVDAIAAGTAVATPQSGEPTFAPKLGIEDGRIDWTRSTGEVDARVRGVTPEPGAHTEVGGIRLKVLEARPASVGVDVPRLEPGELRLDRKLVLAGTADGAMELRRVQPAGRNSMAAADWWRGLGVERADAR
ncbi:methionyl-tRNA formyltransferase [Agromyces luteolus]|uniref:Methionyl-tRNA formyltransferase n=1 Tax=Agromyces luteolus TaxID=88373 RepID=A0A7C9HJ52_9MICO|nr:methionyl-tRNA formyltransferase [Agromyces luteolus]MUN08348.1 methionyl-tRNA formyltransferase [Agromyces luteolus]GLK26880.1 methionyl-tRNA formyltransferase [Agromyces luteolus]